MDNIDAVLQRFPQYTYNNEDRSSALSKLIKSIVDEFNITISNIDRIDKMIGIDNALPDDLYNRFGSLLNIKQNINESDEQYRNRLKISVTSLSGGTAEAIKYAIASSLNIHNDVSAMDRIRVYDAWEYDGTEESIIRDYGYIVCVIDLNQNSYYTNIEEVIVDTANEVKATGVVIQFIYHNFRISYYTELDSITYVSLDTMTYDKVGE